MSGRACPSVCVLTSVCVVLAASSPAQGRVVGRVVHVGFPAGIGRVIREGAWVPIEVELSLEGQSSFDGVLRVEQPDKDGDLVYHQVPVHLREDGGASRPYVLYCVAAPGGRGPPSLSVEVLDERGAVVEVISQGVPVRSLRVAQPPRAIGDEYYLILSLTGAVAGKIDYLTTPDQMDKFDRQIVVAHLKPDELPDRWQGLEAVNCIVWEAADATELSGPQLEALVTWVRQGGLLMMAAAETADTLAKSKRLEPILPVNIGRVISTPKLKVLRDKLLGVAFVQDGEEAEVMEQDDGTAPPWYRRPLPVVLCSTAKGAETVIREKNVHETEDAVEATVVARRAVDRGAVVFVAAELADLLNEQGLKPVEFFKKTLQLRRPRSSEPAALNASLLFPYLEGTVGFRRSTGLYLLGALLFSLAYVGVATFGSWSFLRSRGWTRHAWSVFALVAGAAAALSLVVVQSMRGVGQSLQQLTIVDATVGELSATATAYFGLKTGTHTVLDVWLPADYASIGEPEPTDCYLKPLPWATTAQAVGSGYADPARYELRPGSALLRDVPIRATLKQFEGRWFGSLRRTIQAKVTIETKRDDASQSEGPSDDSTITNNLGCPLTNCLLLQPVKDPFRSFVDLTPRHRDILVFDVGDIGAGETVYLAERIYTDRRTRSRMDVEEWSGQTLGEFQKNWGKNVGLATPFAGGSDVVRNLPLERYQDALLMLTALSEHWPENLQGRFGGAHDFRAGHCRQLDISDRLTRDHVLLIGFAQDQGPVTLCTRKGRRAFRPLRADRAYTVYRFLIPVKRPGESQ